MIAGVVIRLCGYSAILFVFAILFFVLREAAPILFGKMDLVEFLSSPNWRPRRMSARSMELGPVGGDPGGDRLAMALPCRSASAPSTSPSSASARSETLKT